MKTFVKVKIFLWQFSTKGYIALMKQLQGSWFISTSKKKKKNIYIHKPNANLKINGKVYPSDKSEKIMQ